MKKFMVFLLTCIIVLAAFGTVHSANLTQTQVSQLYVSIFGRASEGEGNAYWCANQTDMLVAANTMLDTDPAKTYFGETLNNNQLFIEFIYNNTLGKTYVQDPTGVHYWVGELEEGKSKGEVIATLINAAQDPANAGVAQDQLNNKVKVCNYTADNITTCPDVNDLSAFQEYITSVTSDASTVIAAKALVDSSLISSGLEESTPADENMDGATLDQMYEYIAGSSKFDKLDAVLILRNGKIVSEKYYNGHDKTYKSPVWSVTKGITSLLVGIASDNGVLSDTDYIMDYFSNRTIANPDSRKDLIQIKHLLTMQAGFTWNDSTDTVSLVMATIMGQDTLDYMLGQTMTADPGGTFEYNTGLGTLVDGVIHGASSMHLDEYADKYLFGPLSITDYTWDKDVFNNCLGGMGLSMTARDMAKVGQMALDNGIWNGSPVVSSDWMSTSTTTTIHEPPEYIGYSWRKHSSADTWFYIPGGGGQLIDIHPDENMVIIYKVATDMSGTSTPTMPVDIGFLTSAYIQPACN